MVVFVALLIFLFVIRAKVKHVLGEKLDKVGFWFLYTNRQLFKKLVSLHFRKTIY